ncbi:MAG TPA: flagellar basal body-associated protein FliL [Clostridiaceae bacterium]|nr:flagellar basal body-associated protein FliL [Clostridiaceae bacterium]
MESKGSLFVLLIIVVILTLTLAVMAGYLFFVADTQQTNISQEEDNPTPKRPADEEISKIQLFDNNTFFNLKSEDGKTSVIQINAELSYFKKVKGIKNTEQKITFNINKIKEIIGTYFQSKKFEEITQPEAKEIANRELTKKINEYLLSNEQGKDDIVYEIVFDKWFYQQ